MLNADAQSMSPADVGQRFMSLYTAGDINGMADLCSPDGMLDYVAMGERGRGKLHELGVHLWGMFVIAFEHFRPEVVDVWEDKSKNTAFIATVNRGLQKREIAGIPPRGRELAAPHLFIIEIDNNGLIAKVTLYWDYLTMYQQIGFPTGFAQSVEAKP